jgi:hypothetical protein
LVLKPDSFFVKDDVLGWRMGAGQFSFIINNNLVYQASINHYHERITKLSGKTSLAQTDSTESIFLYGCSYTFGQSVADTCNFPYYLQLLMPEYDVHNKAVPAYGLTQMYLSLQQDVQSGNQPDIAIFNYADFHDERTALSRSWIRRFRHNMIKSGPDNLKINYPFAKVINDDSVVIKYAQWKQWPRDFLLRSHLSTMNLVNSSLDNWHDKKHSKEYSKTTLLLAKEIIRFCDEHEIRVLFYGLNKDSEKTLSQLSNLNVPVMITNVDSRQAGFNCAPQDPLHPNERAHRLYSKELYHFIKRMQQPPVKVPQNS